MKFQHTIKLIIKYWELLKYHSIRLEEGEALPATVIKNFGNFINERLEQRKCELHPKIREYTNHQDKYCING